MVALIPGSALYDEVFANAKVPLSVVSSFPTYGMLANALLNPANRASLNKLPLLNAQQAKDLQLGARYLFEGLAVFRSGKPTGLPETMLGGLRELMRSVDVPAELTDSQVFEQVLNADSPKEVAGALLGTALALMGVAAPVVGIIAGLVVGLAAGVYRALESGTVITDPASEQAKALLYRYFPPLQMGDSDTDASIVNGIIRPAMESGDWTHLYMPRFQGQWHGEERDGGFQFGCGKATGSKKFDGSAGESFDPTGGLGCVPGTATITDLVQVCLPHNPAERDGVSKAFWLFMRGGLDPRAQDPQGVLGKTRVFDTGSFYPMAARLCGMLWNWMMQLHNPLVFRVDPLRLQPKWETYCSGGLEYIRKVCYPWAKNNLFNSDYSHTGNPKDKIFYTFDPNANLEGYFGTAIFHAIGAWGCSRMGSLTAPPKYKEHPPPFGELGSEIGAPRADGLNVPPAYGQLNTGIWSRSSGPFLPIVDSSTWPDKCMGTRYERGDLPIRTALEQLRARQVWALKHSPLAVAGCSRMDAAFVGDPTLDDQLMASRAILLQHKARFELSLNDVRDDEPAVPGLAGGTWRQQLEAAGVTPGRKIFKTSLSITLGKGKDPPPAPAGFVPTNPDPWDPTPPPKPKRVGRKDKAAGGGGFGLIVPLAGLVGFGGMAAAVAHRRKKGRRRRG